MLAGLVLAAESREHVAMGICIRRPTNVGRSGKCLSTNEQGAGPVTANDMVPGSSGIAREAARNAFSRSKLGLALPLVFGAWGCGGIDRVFSPEEEVDAAMHDGAHPDAPKPGSDAAADGGSQMPDVATIDVPIETSIEPDATNRDTGSDAAMVDGSQDGAFDSGTDVVTCSSGAYRCTGSVLQSCVNSTWIDKMTCGSPVLCDPAGTCRPTTCQPGVYQCNGKALQICNPDATGWTDKATCATAALCDLPNKTCRMPACQPGLFQCNGPQLLVCNPDQTGFVPSAACATAALCDAPGGACRRPVCQPGEHQCNGVLLQTCNVDQTGFTTTSTCVTPQLCDATNNVCNPPACAPNAYKCSGAALLVCNSGQTNFVASQNCASQALCDATGGTCKSGCTNLAPLATASATAGGTAVNGFTPSNMNDGRLGCPSITQSNPNVWYWMSNGTAPPGGFVQYDWPIAQTMSMIHIDTANTQTGCSFGGTVNITAGRTFAGGTVQYLSGTTWINIGAFSGQVNDFDFVFPTGPVTTSSLRIMDVVSGTVGNTPIIEWQVYAQTGCQSPLDP